MWFQNRRTKHKRVQPGDESGTGCDEIMTSGDEEEEEDEVVDVDDNQESRRPIEERDFSSHTFDSTLGN